VITTAFCAALSVLLFLCCSFCVVGEYDYAQVLGLSFKFYEAQRSGDLPSTNRISWRADAGLDHKAADGRDVTGGWYDAGDNVKFNLPMAWSAGVIAWSLVDFREVGTATAESLLCACVCACRSVCFPRLLEAQAALQLCVFVAAFFCTGGLQRRECAQAQ
jgi:hypothetical protein